MEVAPTIWSGTVTVAQPDQRGAVERRPGQPEQDPFERLPMAFLVSYPRHSARAYLSDLKAWGAWCTDPACIPSTLGATTSTPGCGC